MEQKIKKAIEHYAPIYSVDEFNHNFNTELGVNDYQGLIEKMGLTTKADTLETANKYAESTKQMYIATVKEIADQKYISSVFEG